MKNLSNQSSLAETDSSLIRAELERLLSDRRFSGARQMSAFLRYIVSETLDGNGNRIKAYTVGVDALGKADDFDAQSDPSVRVLALRLRKSLEAAYADGTECHARIVMTVGSYVPEFYKPHAFKPNSDEDSSPPPRFTTDNRDVTEKVAESVDDSRQEGSMPASPGRFDVPKNPNSASRREMESRDSFDLPRSAMRAQRHTVTSDDASADRAGFMAMSCSMTAWLRETWVLAAAFALLAATWQLSMDPAIAATVSLQGKNLEHIVEQRPKDCPNWFARLAMENT